jgi:hypothetical protein
MTFAGRRYPIERGRVQGDVVRFNIGKTRYTARVDGDRMISHISGEPLEHWRATR